MKILGLSLGELSTAAICVDGHLVACVSEERFSRKKNDECYPKSSIEFCLDRAALKSGSELDWVVIAGNEADLWHIVTRYYSTFSIQDHIQEQHKYWHPTVYQGQKLAWQNIYRDRWDLKQFPGTWSQLTEKLGDKYYLNKDEQGWVNQFFQKIVSDHLGVPVERVVFVDHHTCHAAYAYFGSTIRDDSTLIATMDAYGDGLSATLSVSQNEKIVRKHAIAHQEFRLARFYRYITLLLGMKPNEHEYKVMGLAPYAKSKTSEGPLAVLRNTMFREGLNFQYRDNPKDSYFYFKDKFEGYRFDGIAGALQTYAEEMICGWLGHAMSSFGASQLVVSGGVAMNVKAMGLMATHASVKNMAVPPSGGDESLAIGACFHWCREKYDVVPESLKHNYLGPDVGNTGDVVREMRSRSDWKIIENPRPIDVAKCLADGRIVARASGPQEFGARALGNRSILADPRNRSHVQVINEKIKNRDFWMPFAPAVLDTFAPKYLKNPKSLESPYMTLAFETTDEGYKSLGAGLHPADGSARAQILDRKRNQGFYEIVESFAELTGVGALVNTSFNLHGEPIVSSARDAARVFEMSGIDDLLVDNFLISK